MLSELDRIAAIESTIRDWQRDGDTRDEEDIWPEAEVYFDAYCEKFGEITAAWTEEGMDLDGAADEAHSHAIEAAVEALKEFTSTD